MAEEKKEEAGAEGEKKGGNKMIIIVVAALVVLLIVVGVVMFLLMGKSDEAEKKGEGEKTEKAAPAEHAAEAPAAESGGEGAGAAEAKPNFSSSKIDYKDYLEAGPMFSIKGDIVVNLMSNSGGSYLKCNVTIELEKEGLEECEVKKDIIKSVIIDILASKTVDEASTPKGKQKIQAEIVYALNQFMHDGKVKSVLFTNYIIK
jgi:flagellar protein FliL